jgi:hypothetical protein
MFNVIKFNASCRNLTSVLGVIFFAVAMALLPISAHAQCSKQWDASGEWEIRQGRGGSTVTRLDLKQSGTEFSGKAYRDAGIGTKAMTGDVIGDADGDNFSLTIDWVEGYNDQYVTYRAKVRATGHLNGETSIGPDKRNREIWFSDQSLTCGWSRGKSRGNLTGRLSANDTARPGQATGSLLKGPVMVASQAVFPTPYVPTGFVILTWDAGPDHPNADVWVKYNGSRDRILVMKQPKAGMQVAVQRGQTYSYFLMDGRIVLATATFVAQ